MQRPVIAEDSRNFYLRDERRLMVENLVVVEIDGAMLVADCSKAQEIKTVVKQLEVASCPEG